MRQTCDEGVDLIKKWEGLRLKPYKDAVGLWTVGYGHLILPQERYGTLTEEEAEALLRKDLIKAERAVMALVSVDLSDGEFGALVSFVFNLGAGALKSSRLRRVLNEGEYEEAADQFLRWNKAGGRVLKGLTRRRSDERDLFLSDV